MKRYGIAAVAALLVGAFLFPTSALAGEKREACHAEGNGSYHLINISEKALPKHVDHGDAVPSEAVPGMPGYTFDENCVPEQVGSVCYDNVNSGFADLEYSGQPDTVGNIVAYSSFDGSCALPVVDFDLGLVVAGDSGEAGSKCEELMPGGTVFMGVTAANAGWTTFPADAWLCELAS